MPSVVAIETDSIMDYYNYACANEQDYRDLQARVAEEWKVDGESDGEVGLDPEYPNNSAYMHGYDVGLARYIKRLADAQRPGSNKLCRCGLVREQDCRCDSGFDFEDRF